MEKDLEIKDVRGFIKRRRKLFSIAFFIILIGGLIFALILPPIYKSEATIRLEGQQIPEDFVQPTISDFAEERIEKIGQQVMSRSKLLEVINEFDLYKDLKDKKTDTELVNKMRDNIKLETIRAEMTGNRGRSTTVTVAFILSFEGKDPETVKKVTETLANVHLEEDIKNRKIMVAGTTKFFENEIKRLKNDINNQEKKISEFKKNHLRELPSDQFYNLQAIARLEREISQTDMRLRVLQEKKLLVDSQLANVEPLAPIVVDGEDFATNPNERLKMLRLQLASLQSGYSSKHPDIKKLKREIRKLESEVEISDASVEKVKRLNQLELQLATAIATLGHKHPDVKVLSKEIALLKKEINVTESAKLKISEEKPDNPVYIGLKTQIETVVMEIAALENERRKLNREIDQYQRRLEIAPAVEKELNALNRDYDNLKTKFSEMSNKLMNAQVVQEMEGEQKGERFSITSPAYLPEKPYKPNRLAIILLSVLISIGLSSALVVSQESLDDSVKTSNQLRELTGIPVLSSISQIVTDHEKRVIRLKRLGLTFVTICLIAAVVYYVDRYLIKLELVWTFILDRLNMVT
jgi:uncharacterized protein involved in exopolysaccharide biosynthesis